MSCGQIRLWDSPRTRSSSDILLCSREEYDSVKGLIDDGSLPRPQACFALSTTVREDEKLVLAYYAKHVHFPNCGLDIDVAGMSNEHLGFMLDWEGVVRAICGRESPRLLKKRISLLRGRFPKILNDAECLVDLLTHYVDEVLQPYQHEGLFGGVAVENWTRLWYRQRTSLLRMLGCFSGTVASKSRTVKAALTATIQSVGDLEKRITYYDKASVAERLYWMSAYFGMIGRVRLSEGRFSLSVLYCHRAYDCFFQYKGLSERVLVEGSGRLMYFVDKDDVTLLETVKRLEAMSKPRPDPSRYAFMTRLNMTRNNLMETHGVYACAEADAKRAVTGIAKHIGDIEGTTEWETTVASLTLSFMTAPRLIFDCVASLDTFCERKL
jgi:hypothetical protein